MKKKLLLLVLTVAAAVVLVACACDTTTSPSPSPSLTATPLASATPTAMPDPSPDASMEASPSDSPEQSPDGGTQMVDTENIRAEVEKLSEVKSAVVAVMGDTALVGLTFDDAYQGTLTARISEMVTEKVQAADTAIANVHVTADQTLCEEIESFASNSAQADAAQAQEAFDALKAKIEPAS